MFSRLLLSVNVRERVVVLSPVRLFWRSSLPEPWSDERNNNVRFDEMMRTYIACAMEIRKNQGEMKCWRVHHVEDVFFSSEMLFGLLFLVVCSNDKKTKTTQFGVIKIAMPSFLDVFLLVCSLFLFDKVPFFPTKKSINHLLFSNHSFMAIITLLPLDAKPKRPTCQSQGTVAISCVNFIVVPVPRSESVSKTVVFSWLERVWWVWGARLVVSWFWIRHVDVENLCWDTGWNLAIRILSTQPGQLFHPEMAEWGISW